MDIFKQFDMRIMHVNYEEFMEMIARAADIHFLDTEQNDLPLYEKILLVLDEFLRIVGYYSWTCSS